MTAEPDVKRETPIWAEVAQAEVIERPAALEEPVPALAASVEAPAAPSEPAVAPRPSAAPGAVRFASEVLPAATPTAGGRKGRGRRGAPARETEEQARARRAAASRRGGSRRALEEEIEEELEAVIDDGEDFGFFDREDGE
jgi:hypothetical protein